MRASLQRLTQKLAYPMKKLVILFGLLVLSACSDDPQTPQGNNFYELPPEDDAGTGDEGVDQNCEAETDEAMCARLQYVCGPLTDIDNCGDERSIESCGDPATVCQAFETCEAGVCGCEAETDAEFCERADYECGELTQTDNCGTERTVNCDPDETACNEYETCGAETPGSCGCIAETELDFCIRLGVECGEWIDIDNCGTERTVNCGDPEVVCGAGETCGEEVAGMCSCVPETDEEFCARNSWECGELTADDNCGAERTIDCGLEEEVCEALETCGGAGVEGQCGCQAASDPQLCQLNNTACGPLEVVDECGVTRTIPECGTCIDPETCGGGGVEGQCGCTGDSEQSICTAAGAECGDLDVVDNCNDARTINCGLEDAVCTNFDTCGGGGTENTCGCTPVTCASEGLLCGTHPDGCGGTITCSTFCVEKLSAGVDHVCAMGTDRLKCWGRNHLGQLGDGTTTQRNNPVNITGLPSVADVAAGFGNTCAVTDTGAVHCWGSNAEGQLGVGTTVDNRSPGSPAINSGASQVVVGETHVCALVNGGVRCWGSNTYGKVGRAGLNFGAKVGVPNPVDNLTTDVVQLAAGLHHTCALKADGTVWCWGRNRFGQLGNLQTQNPLFIEAFAFDGASFANLDLATYSQVPVQVATLPQSVFITAGRDHTCAIDVDDNVWCWGSLVRQPTATSNCPVDTGTVDNNNNPIFRNGESCAIFPKADPLAPVYPIARYTTTVTNTDCVVGDSCGNNQVCGPVSLKCESYPISNIYVDRAALSPVQVGLTEGALYLGSGANHVCAVVEDPNLMASNVRCFGLNAFGQLGDGTDNGWTDPVSLYLDTNDEIVRATAVAAGANYSCALVDDSNVKCWGSNQYGQIGNSALVRDESFRPYDVKLNFQP